MDSIEGGSGRIFADGHRIRPRPVRAEHGRGLDDRIRGRVGGRGPLLATQSADHRSLVTGHRAPQPDDLVRGKPRDLSQAPRDHVGGAQSRAFGDPVRPRFVADDTDGRDPSRSGVV